MSPVQVECQFALLLERLGTKASGRYHTCRALHEDYDVSETVVGSGANGNVVLARRRTDMAEFVIKTMAFDDLAGMNEWKMLEKELEALFLVDHDSVLSVTEVYEASDAIHLVMPYMAGGQLITKENADVVSHHSVRKMAKQLLEGLAHIHSIGVVHKDIKPANIVLNQGGDIVKVIDFGMCSFWKAGDAKLRVQGGTVGYMSPELLSGSGYTSQTDMWSLGATIFVLLVGSMPFMAEDAIDQHFVDELLESKAASGLLAADATHFLSRLLRVNPTERPTAQQALSHPFVAQANAFVTQTGARAMQSKSVCGTRRARRQPRRCLRPQRGLSTRRSNGTSCVVQLDELLKVFDKQNDAIQSPEPKMKTSAATRWADLLDEDDEPNGWCMSSDDFVRSTPTATPIGNPPGPVRWADLLDDEDDN